MLDALYDLIIGPLILVIEISFSILWRLLNDEGLAVVGLSIVVSLLTLPLYRMADAQQNAERQRQRAMEHWVTHIKKHFKGDEQYMMLATYYRQQGYHPLMALTGSVSLLLQVPFFIAAYRYLSDLALLHGASFLAIQDLSAPDALIASGGITINVLPIAMTLLNAASTAVYTKDLALRDKVQAYGLAALFLVLLYNSPSGLVLYWTCNQLFSLGKNIVTKQTRNPRAVATALAEAALLALLSHLIYHGTIASRKGWALVITAVIASQVALLGPYVTRKLRKGTRPTPATTPGDHSDAPTFLLASALLSIVLGLLIPSALIAASPSEFVDTSNFVDPMTLVSHTFCVYAGLFVLWVGVFWWLANPSARRLISLVLWLLAGICLVNYLCFGLDLGILGADLHFETTPSYDTAARLVNLAVLAAVMGALWFVWQRLGRFVTPALVILCVALTGLCVPNFTAMASATAEALATIENAGDATSSAVPLADDGEPLSLFSLSRSRRNVVVLFLDRGMSLYLPYMMEERPDLAAQFDGFTYYPNTISFGGSTVFGSPALYGGYEYTPTAMNERDDELCVDKHNEAVKVMPTMFSSAGFNVTVCDPAEYDYVANGTNYSSLVAAGDNISAYHTANAYTRAYLQALGIEEEQDRGRTFVYYSLFKCAPVALQAAIYDGGRYLSVARSETGDINLPFVHEYATLAYLNDLTDVADDAPGTFALIHNSTPHEPANLQLPDYLPSTTINNDGFNTTDREAPGMQTLQLDTNRRRAHYYANMASMLKIGEWLDFLREEGVYDNTRIIIVSDHGFRKLRQSDEYLVEWDKRMDGQRFNPLFMVKDFDAHGFKTSNEFMTNADTPWLAMQGVLNDMTNPYTGRAIAEEPKEGVEMLVTTSLQSDTNQYHKGTTFDTGDGYWYSVHDNLFDKNNWKLVGRGENSE